ncbi:hypothetical protein CHS0354_002154 [Potamilus streckersoni]|uniref:FAM124 domain-containing protein n=1 Tax=Potamilus streckersoni TaxID=2493646 RepID=A0AAE0RS90_9BIVA|nr:hypothetical protein CHS0354_002154 [Potamilus streckersoni]
MDTYLQRNYKSRKSHHSSEENKFPFWDYRSRRGSPITSSCHSSSGSSYDGYSVSSVNSLRSDAESMNSSMSSSDSDSVALRDRYRITVQLLAESHEMYPLMDLYQPIINWIDRDLRLLRISERKSYDCSQTTLLKSTYYIPSTAIMIFLHEDEVVCKNKIMNAKCQFEHLPWKYHHSEHVSNGSINPYPYNSHDYFYTSEEYPLWAVRQVHYGKEHLRIVLFTSEENWDDMVQFYKLILCLDPDVNKQDFCMFTIHSHIHYDIQFSLKKIQGDTKIRPVDCVKLQFRVTGVGHLVPLFPNICKPVSNSKWETTDHDGNIIVLDVAKTPRERSRAGSVRSRTSRQSSLKSTTASISSIPSSQSNLSRQPSTSSDLTSVSSGVIQSDISMKTVESASSVSSESSSWSDERDEPYVESLHSFYV